MGEEHAFLDILIDEMALQLTCTTPDCNHGYGGNPYQTPSLGAHPGHADVEQPQG